MQFPRKKNIIIFLIIISPAVLLYCFIGASKYQEILHKVSSKEYVYTTTDKPPQQELPNHLAQADLFIFASGCENMPNTLVEAMAVGLPIACSNRGPMPEVLADGGVYFDPEDADSIAEAIEQIVQSPALRLAIAQRAKVLSQQYNWKRCADETWAFVAETYLRTKI